MYQVIEIDSDSGVRPAYDALGAPLLTLSGT